MEINVFYFLCYQDYTIIYCTRTNKKKCTGHHSLCILKNNYINKYTSVWKSTY